MIVARMIVLGGVVAGCLGHAVTARALSSLTVDKCLAAQIKIAGKGVAAETGCHAKGAAKGLATDPTCLGKAQAKVGPALDGLEAKLTCFVEGSGATRTADVTAFAASTDGTVGHAAGKCDAAKTKLVGKLVAALTGCYAKAAGKTGTVDPACAGKAATKLTSGVAKAETGADCSHTGQAAFLMNAARAFVEAQACALDPSDPECATTCGNGLSDPGEPCDASAAPTLWNQCGAEFSCAGCNCTCPTTVVFTPDATAPESVLDTGWTGISHRAPIVGGGDVTVQVACAALGRPCGVCPLTGPVANPQAGNGRLDDQRCTADTSARCTSDGNCRFCAGGTNHGAQCAVGSECPGGSCDPAGTCAFYFGAPLPLAAGGVTTCVVNAFAGPVTGTANIESGEASTSAPLTSRVFSGIAIDHPCPRCSDAGPANDGIHGGTCDGGSRVGLACDGNGSVPGRPDFGTMSLDCPPIPGALLATLPIALDNATGPVAKTLTTDSPSCTGSGAVGDKCLCDTCNNASAGPCASNADCPTSGGNPGICGGRRCLGGTNAGAPCSATSACPGSGVCLRPGEPTRPSSCLDDSSTPNRLLECADTDGDGEGACTHGPIDTTCALASGHAQRGCLSDADCGGGADSCESTLRRCFLTGGGTFQPLGQSDGTDTLAAVGMADTPVRDTSSPTLGSVFCVGPTGAPAINNVAGLPGPGRVTIKGDAVGHP